MKKILSALVTMILSFNMAYAQQEPDLTTINEPLTVGNLKENPTLGHVTYSSQPDQETIPMLKEKGYDLVLSVKFDDEDVGFDEQQLVEGSGMEFRRVSFYKGSYNDRPRAVDANSIEEISKILRATAANGQKVLLHCGSGQRAAGALAGSLVIDHGYSTEDAMKVAGDAGLTSQNVTAALSEYFKSLEP